LDIKHAKNIFAVELRTNPPRELTALPRLPSWIKGRGPRKGEGAGKKCRGKGERKMKMGGEGNGDLNLAYHF